MAFSRLIGALLGVCLGLLQFLRPCHAYTLSPVQSTYDVSSQLMYLEDPSSRLTVVEVLRKVNEFKRSEKKVLSVGYSHSTYWIKLELQNDSSILDWVLNNEYPLVSYQRLFLYNSLGAQILEPQESGRMVAFHKRYISHRTPNFRLKLPMGEKVTVLIEAHSQGSLQFPLSIRSERVFDQYRNHDHARLGFFYGYLISLILFNLMLFMAIRSLGYLIFALTVLSFLAIQVFTSGLAGQLIFGDFPVMISFLLIFSIGSAIASHSWFTQYFLSLVERRSKWVMATRTLIVLGGLLVIGFFFFPYSLISRLGIFLGLLTGVVSFTVGLTSWRAGFESARMFVIGWMIFFLGMLTYGLAATGGLPANTITENGLQWGAIGEALFMTLALGDRWRKLRSDSVRAKQRIADLQARLNRGLESRVTILDRTAAGLEVPFQNMKGSVHTLTASHREFEKLLNDLLVEGETSAHPEVNRVREFVQKILDKVNRSLSDIEGGMVRMGGVVAQIHSMQNRKDSGKEQFALSLPWDIATSRLREGVLGPVMARVMWTMDRDRVDSLLLDGNPHLYGIAIEAVVASLLKRVASSSSVITVDLVIKSRQELHLCLLGEIQVDRLKSDDTVFKLVAQVLGGYGGLVSEPNPGKIILKLYGDECESVSQRKSKLSVENAIA